MNLSKSPLLRYSNLFIVSLCISASIQSQTPLNEVSDFGYFQQNMNNLTVVDNRIFYSGNVLRKDLQGNNPLEREFLIAEIDSSLHTIHHSIFEDENDFSTGFNGSWDLIGANGNLYSVTLEKDASDVSNSFGAIVQYEIENNQFSFFVKKRDSLYNSLAFPVNLINEDEELICLYTSRNSDNSNTILLEKYDLFSKNKTGEYRLELEDHFVTGFNIVKYKNGYLIGGYQGNTISGATDLMLIQLDLNLALDTIALFSDLQYGGIDMDMLIDDDNNIILTTLDEIGQFPDINSRSQIMKITESFDKEWEIPFGYPTYGKNFVFQSKIVSSQQDNSYIVAGREFVVDSNLKEKGIIGKISAQGDTLWTRRYEPISVDEIFSSHFEDIIATSGQNYIAIGSTSPLDVTDEIFTKIWMIKFDENGNIIFKDTTDAVELVDNFALTIYPNPASDILFIEIDEIRNLSIRLLNTKGQKVLEKLNTKPNHTYIMDTSTLDTGMYYLQITALDGEQFVKQIVIN